MTDRVIQNVGSVDNIGGLDHLTDDDRAALVAAFERGSMKEGGHDEEAVSSPPSKVCYRWLDAGTGDSLACGPYQLIHCSGPATYYFEYFL